MRLRLTHGRDGPEQEMDGWGYDGPALDGVDSVQQMYGDITTVRFTSFDAYAAARELTGWDNWDDKVLEIQNRDDLIEVRRGRQPSQFFGSLSLYDAHAPDAVTTSSDALSYTRDQLIDALGSAQRALRAMSRRQSEPLR